MPLNTEAIDKAVWTFCEEPEERGQRRPLPWAFWEPDDSTGRRFVVPVYGAVDAGGLATGTSAFYRIKRETMPYRAFPEDSQRSNGAGDPNRAGPEGVHFFGRV